MFITRSIFVVESQFLYKRVQGEKAYSMAPLSYLLAPEFYYRVIKGWGDDGFLILRNQGAGLFSDHFYKLWILLIHK